jgi:hypothetical protein
MHRQIRGDVSVLFSSSLFFLLEIGILAAFLTD